MFKTRPKARIKIGQHFMGLKTSTTAEGVALYKEWDEEDRAFYYWEEWELRGFNDIDSWVEYDHYTNELSLYEPIRRGEKIDPRGLVEGQTRSYQDGDITRTLLVKDVGEGFLERLEGTVSYHIFQGDTLEYADLVDITDRSVRFAAERYNENEFDMYRAVKLTRSDQKRLFGKIVAPILWGKIFSFVAVLLIVVFFLAMSMWPRTVSTCTPRTISPNSSFSQTSTSSSEQICQTRTVYGFGSGGSGVGK